MKKIEIFFGALVIALALSCSSKPKGEEAQTSAPEATTSEATGDAYKVSPEASFVNWSGTKIGGGHEGNVVVSSGTLNAEGDNITGGNFVIDLTSINATDLEEADDKQKLEGHLKSPDFFDVAQFPSASFEITKTTKVTNDPEANHLIYGNLTVKGVTKQISFKAKSEVKNNSITVRTPPFTFDRTEFNIQYASSKFFDDLKDRAINDQIGVQINLIGTK